MVGENFASQGIQKL